MSNKFLSLAHMGKNQWWRYLLAIILVLFLWQVIGGIPVILLAVFLQSDQNPETRINPQTHQFEGVDPLILYLVTNFSFVCFLIGLYIAVRFIHQRKFVSLVTPRHTVNWSRIIQGFAVYFVLAALAGVIESVIKPGSYKLMFDPGKFLIFLPIAIVLTSIQSSVEELFFRGYLMQGIGLKTHKSIIPIIGTAILFMLPHLLNPEVKSGFVLAAVYYLALGLFLAVVAVKDNRLELALGVHIGNNMFVVLLANYAVSAVPAPSVFIIQQLDPIYNLVSSLAIFALFYLFFFRDRKRVDLSSQG